MDNKGDQVELNFVEFINIFLKWQKMFVAGIGLSALGAIVVFSQINLDSQFKLEYKIAPVSEVELKLLLKSLDSPEFIQQFHEELGLEYVPGDSISPFLFEKGVVNGESKRAESFTVLFSYKGGILDSDKILKAFEATILENGMREYFYRSKKSDYLLRLIDFQRQTVQQLETIQKKQRLDNLYLSGFSRVSESGRNAVAAGGIYTKVSTVKGAAELGSLREEVAVDSVRRMLAPFQQKQFLGVSVREAQLERDFLQGLLSKIELVKESVVKSDMQIDGTRIKLGIFSDDFSVINDLVSPVNMANKDWMAQYTLITPNARVLSNSSKKIQYGILAFCAGLILSIFSVLIADFWSRNKNKFSTTA